MKLTIFAAGSRGDIQPCVALAKGLQRAGHEVHLAAPSDFAGFVQEHGVAFRALRGDVQQLMASDTGREFMQSGGVNPLKSIRAIRTLIAPVVMQMTADALDACRDADALICLGVLSAFGQTIAEILGIPQLNVEPTPLLATRAFPAPSWPVQRNLGGWHNLLSGWAMLHVVWLWYQPFVRDFRRRLGLPRLTGVGFHRAMRTIPMLGAYSPHLIGHPPDWPRTLHITGYWFLDARTDWQPPADLQAFLDAGDPPVYIGFGSMAGRDPEALARLAVRALAESGQRGLTAGRRGVLLTGWGGMRGEWPVCRGDCPVDRGGCPVDRGEVYAEPKAGSVFVAEAVPHSWLFPRVAAVVHHGGAGTTAEGLRAGRPTVIVPFIVDQSFWGARVQAMGLGPPPIPHKRLTADRLAQAIDTAVTDAGIRQRAADCGAAIRAEHGVETAVALIERYLT
jgi:sterol 3beta-glucosyltransferase